MTFDMNGFGSLPENGTALPGVQPMLEHKFMRFDAVSPVDGGLEISGYASLFGDVDQGGDVVEAGAYAKSLAALARAGRRVKMLWQHEPSHPIGVWDEVREDGKGLWVTPAELKIMLGASEAKTPMLRDGLGALMALYPDEIEGEGDG